ncbi:GPSM1 [Symbiodinium sp. CCMP2592]|nr:GPSM1 [Symbiodinium sp. CCMP2592]
MLRSQMRMRTKCLSVRISTTNGTPAQLTAQPRQKGWEDLAVLEAMSVLDFDEGLNRAAWASEFWQSLYREEADKALATASKALQQARDASARAIAHNGIARAHLLAREFLKAEEAANLGVEAARGAKDSSDVLAHCIAAKAFLAHFRLDDAFQAAEAAVSLACDQGRILLHLLPASATSFPSQAQQKGKSIQAAALTARAQAPGPPHKHSSADEADVMQQVCLARDKKQEASKAVARQAAALFRECGEKGGEAMALEVLVRACLVAKKGNEALRAANEALALCQDGADAESRSLLLVAKTKQALGDAQEAQEAAQKAVALFEKTDNRQMQGITLKQLAEICFAGGDSIDGWQYTKEALECFREVGHKSGEATTLCQIAAAHVDNGSCEEALRIAEEAVTLCRDNNFRTQLGATLSVMASAHVAQLPTARSDQQEQQINWKARLAGKEALGIQQSVGDRVGEAQTLKSLASAFLNYGNAAEARAKAKLAVDIGKEIGNKQIEGENLLLVAQSKLHENKEEGARLARLSEKLLREAGASSAARSAGDVYDFIRDYGVQRKETKKDRPKQEADIKTDITIDIEEGKHRLGYFHGFTARAVRPRA